MRRSLADEAYEELRSAIVDGRLEPGTQVLEETASELLGVSRTPLRLALRRIELEGYVQRDARGRLVVDTVLPAEVVDLFFVRTLLETFAARLAAEHISDEELDALRTLVDEDLVASRRGDVERLAEINTRLHSIVLRASRNRVLVEMVELLHGRIAGLNAFAVGSREDRRHFAEDHAELVRLLADGDGDSAAGLVRKHLGHARDLLAERLDEARLPRGGTGEPAGADETMAGATWTKSARRAIG